MPTPPSPPVLPPPPRRATVRERLIGALVPWFLTGERPLGAAGIEDLLAEPEVAPLATQLGYLPGLTRFQRERLETDVRRAIRWARTAEAVHLGQAAGVPSRTDRVFSLALADVVAATREAVRRLAAAERDAYAGGDTPAAVELDRLGARAREIAGACELLYESRALRTS